MSTAMIAITTSSSTSVNPRPRGRGHARRADRFSMELVPGTAVATDAWYTLAPKVVRSPPGPIFPSRSGGVNVAAGVSSHEIAHP
jgi:hypothetical protein